MRPPLSHGISPRNRCGIFNSGTPELQIPQHSLLACWHSLCLRVSSEAGGKIPLLLTLVLGGMLMGCSRAANTPVDPLRATTVAEALAQSNTVQALDLFDRHLRGFPQEILTLKHLRWLNLRTCTLGRVPDELAMLAQLTRLDLSQTGLTNLTPAVGQLSQLTHLWLNDNPLPALPREIGSLSQLMYFNADRTRLTELPQEFGALPNLKWLRLNHNQLTAMPTDISGLAKNLKVLYLIGNPIPEQEQKRIQNSLPDCNVIFHTGSAETKQKLDMTL